MPTLDHCLVCGHELGAPIWTSPRPIAVTSLAEVRRYPLSVHFCETCGHVQIGRVEDAVAYYDQNYKFYVANDDEDQIYEFVGDAIVYRNQHQAKVFLDKLDLPQGAAVLDFGSAKGQTLRHVVAARPDIKPHVFEVSDIYRPLWSKWLPEEAQASHELPARWEGRFDVIFSGFTHHHVPRPVECMTMLRRFLKPGGIVYFTAPDQFVNVGDFIVADHPQRYTAPSIETAVRRAGFELVDMDWQAHYSAFVAVARMADPPTAEQAAWTPRSADIAATKTKVRRLADYWTGFVDDLAAFEAEAAGAPLAIYGAFVYGTYIYENLNDKAAVRCFVDRNPFYAGKRIDGKPVVRPEDLPADVSRLCVGTKPQLAEGAIRDAFPQRRDLTLFTLRKP